MNSLSVDQDSNALDAAALTHGASAKAKGVICREAAEAVASAFGDPLRALVLTGSLARDEAAIAAMHGTLELLGDAEFLLVFAENAVLPEPCAIHDLAREIEKRIARHGVIGCIDLGAVHPDFLRTLRPHIFAYELRSCGQVVRGDPAILTLIPAFGPSDIPLEDAWRLLSNRMIEQLAAAAEFPAQPERLSRSAQYRTVKLYRDMATSLLVFARAYEPTYRGRAERLGRLAADSSARWDLPFSLTEFSNRVSACTTFKLQQGRDDAHGGDCPPSMTFWRESVTQAHLLWRWELMRLTGGGAPLSDSELMKKWMKLQPVRDRVRGWAYVLRRCGWHRSWRMWPRWLRLGLKASPRYCVYAAASQLFFHLPGAVGLDPQSRQAEMDWKSFYTWLPVGQHDPKHPEAGWRQAALAVNASYKQFLTNTRA